MRFVRLFVWPGARRPLFDAKLKKERRTLKQIEGAPLSLKLQPSPPKLFPTALTLRAGGESALISATSAARRVSDTRAVVRLRFDETYYKWVGLV